MSTTIIGLDIGYGYTKALTSTGGVDLPSVMGQADRIRYESDLAPLDLSLLGIIVQTERHPNRLAARFPPSSTQ